MIQMSLSINYNNNSNMLNCQFCFAQLTPLLFTKCCKASICQICCEKTDRKLACHCGRQLPFGRKNYYDFPQIIEVINKYVQAKGKQCDRCDSKAEIECEQCRMVYCQNCNSEVHAGLGFAKHERRKKSDSRGNLQKMKRKEVNCLQHGQIVMIGCQCGAGLCVTCSKQHKQLCPKGFKTKVLKQLKEEYYLNMLLKMRQLTFFKEKLIADREKYVQHFKTQQISFNNTQKNISQQFQYLTKLIQIKQSEAKQRMNQYWKSCETTYSVNLNKISEQIKRFDSYAQLLPLFTQNFINLDYFQKKIKRFVVPFEFVNLKSVNVEQTQASIMGISVLQKSWELQNLEAVSTQNIDTRPSLREQARLFGNLQHTGQLVSEYIQNPSKDRQINLLSSHSEVYFSFIHLPFQNMRYQIEYGVGMKIKGQQIFKKIANSNGFGIIENLNSNTKYRVRMRVAEGNWGPISQTTTLDIPKFNLESSLCAKAVGDNSVQLGKGGIIYGSNQINFGIHRWIIKFTSKNISYQETQTACMSVGVSNKQTKKATFVGTTLNYGYQKSEIVLKILLDCSQKRLIILNCTTNQEQSYQNLPNFPLFPTIQNKGNAQILVRYNLTTDDLNSC